MLNVGEKAPDFELMDAQNENISLNQFFGSWIVLYFYPKDDTPGCTAEACSFRDNYDEYSKRGVKVIGVSADTEDSHKKFSVKHNLPFILLSDPAKEVIAAYGAKGLFTKRITYIINPNGEIAKAYAKVSPGDHGAQILSDLSELMNS